jgi:hypothetical protein
LPSTTRTPSTEITNGARVRTARSREPRRDETTERGARTEARRVASQHLPARRERRIDVGDARTRARGDDELGRVVIDDPGERRHVEHITADRLTVEVAGSRRRE